MDDNKKEYVFKSIDREYYVGTNDKKYTTGYKIPNKYKSDTGRYLLCPYETLDIEEVGSFNSFYRNDDIKEILRVLD